MKRYSSIFQIVFGLLVIGNFWACRQENALFSQKDDMLFSRAEQSLNLKAPSGLLIASSVSDLREETVEIVRERFGVDKKFEIIELNYLGDSKDGYVVFVEYKTEDGIRGNYLKARNSKIKFNTNQVVMGSSSLTKSKSKSEGDSGDEYVIRCLAGGNCSQSQCTLGGEFVDGLTSVWCNCAECTLKISQ